MKLTPSQLATIETYLLSWGLQFRDFYDEMFDHFCNEIEQRMSKGTSFDDALVETSYLFDSYEYGVGLSPKAYGLKAFEMEWEAKFRKRNNALIISELKRQFLSVRFLIWLVAYLTIYQASSYFDVPKLWILSLIPSMVLIGFTLTYIYSWKGFRWKNLFFRKEPLSKVHKSKDTLVSKPRTFIHQGFLYINLFNIFLNAPRLFIDDCVIPLHVGITFSVAMMLLSYAFHKVVTQSIEEEKENSLIHQLDHSQLSNP